MTDWSELKRLAEEATPGPWGRDGSYVCPVRVEGGTTYIESWRAIADSHHLEDVRYIAAANPTAILALIAENEQLREDHDRQWRLAQSGIQNTEAVLAENAKLRAESEAMASLLRRFVENEHNPSEDQNERHWYHGEAETLLAKISGKHRDYALVPEESLQRMVSERDQLRVEVEPLRRDAERYQWLRARNGGPIGIIAYAIEPENEMDLVEDKADAAIDAAMGKGGRADA